jgi:hypothetical protein
MRRLLTLSALLVVIAVALFVGTPTPLFATMCTTTCTHATLSCTPVNSCTSIAGTSIKCDGVTTTCTAADQWCLCELQCEDDRASCIDACELAIQCRGCNFAYNQCVSSCGTKPANLTSCQ